MAWSAPLTPDSGRSEEAAPGGNAIAGESPLSGEEVSRIAQKPTVNFDWIEIPISEVHLGASYQRKIEPEWVAKIARDFNPLMMQSKPIVVNVREDGRMYAVDGQHRCLALIEKFGKDVRWKAMVFYGLDLEDEALLFNMQDDTKTLSPIQRWKAGLISGREPYVSINRRVESTGWTVAQYPNAPSHQLECISALIRVGDRHHPGMLEEVLAVYRDAWGLDRAPNASMVEGMAQFLTWYEGEYRRKNLVTRLNEFGREFIIIEADKRRILDRVDRRSAVGMVLVNLYNHGRRPTHRLMAWESKVITRARGARKKKETPDNG